VFWRVWFSRARLFSAKILKGGAFMTDYNILIAFANEKVSYMVAKMLTQENIRPAVICSSGDAVRRHLGYYRDGIIICGYKLKDCTIIQLAEDIPDEFDVILIGSVAQIELCENEKIFKLGVPLKKYDLICSISMIFSSRKGTSSEKAVSRGSEEKRIIQRAKEFLIDRYSVSENAAHRYIQKTSMVLGMPAVEVASAILAERLKP